MAKVINQPLADLFRGHGIQCSVEGGWITFPVYPSVAANAELVRVTQNAKHVSVQLDVRVRFDETGRTLVESFGGFGGTEAAAARDAFENLIRTTLHVLLAALFDRPDPVQVEQEQWVVGGRDARATIGGIGIRGKPPLDGPALLAWFEPFVQQVKQSRLTDGVHWVRLYVAQMGHAVTACELLIDNEPWDELHPPVAALAWPLGDAFYSLRLFIVLSVGR